MPEKPSQHPDKHEQGLPEEYNKAKLKEHAESVLNFAVKNAREILKNPKKVNSFMDKIKNDRKLEDFFNDSTRNVKGWPSVKDSMPNWFIQTKMIESVKNDTDFMKEIINKYMKSTDDVCANVCREFILKIQVTDDGFFKKIVKESKYASIERAAIKRIKDQKYLTEYVKQVDNGVDNEAYIACQGLTDQNLTKLVKSGIVGSASRKLALEALGRRKLDRMKNNNK